MPNDYQKAQNVDDSRALVVEARAHAAQLPKGDEREAIEYLCRAVELLADAASMRRARSRPPAAAV